MYKSKRQKNRSFDWYGLSQRFSIRKYHFGAESVLLGTALILGAAQTTAKAEEAATDNKTEAVTSTSKDDEGAVAPANVTLPATEATTGSPVLYKKELREEEIAKLAAEVSKKDEKATETATTDKPEDADKEKATLTATSIDKKSEKAVDDKADKKDEKKAEKPIAATKTILEQLTSEAEVLNTTAANYAEKKVEDKSSKEAIAAAVAAAKVEITASKKVLNDKDVTAEQLNLQLQRMSSAIEAVYTEMKRAGHVGKVEAVLAGETTTNTAIVSPTTKTPVKNINELTDEEVAAVKREIMNANPSITDPSMIEVVKKGNGTAGGATVTLNGVKSNIPSGDTVVGTAGTKNLEQLKNNINWFDFAAASITYPNGTVVGPARRLAQPITKTVTYPNGDGKADVLATDTTKGWKAAGTAKFAEKTSPVVKGYVVKPNQDTQGDLVEADGSKVKASTTDLTVDSPNQDLKVRYVPVGTWTPKVAKGETPINPIPYPKDPGKVVDPNDPNKPSVPVVPHIPGTTPQVPKDSTKLIGPNNPLRPVTPSTPEPGKPVFPEDPNSPVWPETVKDMVTESSATRTITYVDRIGKEVAATHTETIKFKRTAKVNLVTGNITYGDWTVVGNDTILDGNKLPKVDGYIARGGDIKESQEDVKAEVGKNITQTVVYAKLGSWIPRLPEGQTKVPPTQYPNDPTDPTKPGTDKTKVPYVPGFIPVDPTVYGWST